MGRENSTVISDALSRLEDIFFGGEITSEPFLLHLPHSVVTYEETTGFRKIGGDNACALFPSARADDARIFTTQKMAPVGAEPC